MDFTLTAEQVQYRNLIRRFAQERIEPIARQLDEEALYPTQIVDEMRQLGLYGLTLPQEYGGSGVDSVTYCLALEELAKAAAGVAVIFAVQNSIGAFTINEHGTPEQKEEILPKMATGEILTSLALTEEAAGSDAGNVQTTAIRDGDFFVLNGKKRFITNGKYANLHLVVALTNPARGKKGLSCILVPSNTPGFSVSRTMNPMGQRCSDTAELEFENCRVPAANLLGKENRGLSIALRAFDGGRFSVAAIALGCAQAAFEKALRYAQRREQFGQPIIGFQSVEFMLAEMGTQIEAARLMIHRAASLKDKGLPYTKESSMAKMFATEAAEMVCHRAIQIFGGSGYMRENDVERYYRDQRICQIYEGTNQIMRWIIAIHLIKEFGAK
jgi:alkylation response protein AidB-like acyl-CoA dehydrogenase